MHVFKDHAIGTLDLAVAPRVGDRGVVDVDSVVLAEIPEGGGSEGFAWSVMILLGTPN
jgi:hypothetical protein